MGRKIDMKKIEDTTRCQVTFSKRRSSLMKKANEIAVCCDVDVAFVAFSPSGRISKFCNQKRIEDVLHRYVNLPVEKRLNHINNVQGKLEKLRQLGHIKGDTSKLQYLDKQIENLELQIKKSGLELQILETDLRDYELGPEQEPSLHQLSWCERNLKHSLQRIIAKKNAMVDNLSASYQQQNFQMGEKLESQAGNPFSSNFNQNEQVLKIENTSAGQILMQLDPWISPYSARARESILQDLFDHATNKNISRTSDTHNFSMPSNILNSSPILVSETSTPNARISSFHVPQEKFLVVDHSLLNFHDQNSGNNNFDEVGFSDRIHMSTQSLCNIQGGPRFTSTTTITTKGSCPKMAESTIHHPHHDDMQTASQSQYSTNSNLRQLSSSLELEAGQQSTAHHHLNDMDSNEDYYNINCDVDTHADAATHDDQHHNVFPHNEVCQINTLFDDLLPPEDAIEDNTIWRSKIQKSALWEWDDLLLDVQDFF